MRFLTPSGGPAYDENLPRGESDTFIRGRSMVKANLARIVYETHGGMSYREAKNLVEMMIDRIKASLAQGENVKLSGFGSLNVVPRKGRLGRNPQTGDRIQLKPSKYVTFRPSRIVQY